MTMKRFFDLVTLTLIYDLDLDTLPLDLHVKIQFRMSVRSAGRVRQTDTQIDNAKTITSVTSETWGVMRKRYIGRFLMESSKNLSWK